MSTQPESSEPEVTFDGIAQGAAPAQPKAESPQEPVAAPVKNFTEKAQYTSEGMGENFNGDNETAFMPSARSSVFQEALQNLPNTPIGNDAKSQDWLGIANGGNLSVPFDQALEDTVTREGANFQQSVTSPTGELAGFVPAMKIKPGQKPTGAAAVFHIRQVAGIGTVFAIPLWHSGFWLTVKAPDEQALLELFRQISADKISLGRQTYGYLFSNGGAYTSKLMLDFVMEHLYESSLLLGEKEDLRQFIRVPDLQLLIWGIACATWPSGFQYQRSCIADIEKCRHVIKEKLALPKLLWTDVSSLSDYQIRHMTKRQRGDVKSDEVKRYVEEFVRGQAKLVEVGKGVSVTLHIPYVQEHIASGYRWVSTIEETYANVLLQEQQERDTYLLNQGRATAMRQYAHFVKAIVADGQEYEEPEVIEEALNVLTARDDVREAFLEKVREFMNNSVISLVAIPTFTCPACGGHQTGESHHNFPELIPLDVQQTFFQVLVQRLRKIEER